MRERTGEVLRICCRVLVVLVALQLLYSGYQACQLVGVKMPAVPSLETNAVAAAGPAAGPKPSSTNLSAMAAGTNKPSITAITNLSALALGTNKPPISTNAGILTAGTNLTAGSVMASAPTNAIPAIVGSNINLTATTNGRPAIVATNNLVAVTTNNPIAQTNLTSGAMLGSLNKHLSSSTNHLPGMPMAAGMPGMPGMRMMPGMMGGMPGMPGAGPPLPPLPAEIQARVDKIVNSEIFAPVMHPMPMGLMGIAGETAFLRTSSGQTGLVKVGDSLGDLKLDQIGINRVLVEQNGEKKELMIFEGYGGESLLSKTNEISK